MTCTLCINNINTSFWLFNLVCEEQDAFQWCSIKEHIFVLLLIRGLRAHGGEGQCFICHCGMKRCVEL